MKWVYNLAVILFSCPSSRANLALIECWLMCCWEQRRRSNGGTSQLHVCLGWFQWCSIHSLVMKITTMETKDRYELVCSFSLLPRLVSRITIKMWETDSLSLDPEIIWFPMGCHYQLPLRSNWNHVFFCVELRTLINSTCLHVEMNVVSAWTDILV